MTGIYLDTSALAKWYLNEALSDEVEAYIQANAPFDISTLTVLEMRSLLSRRKRRDEIDPELESRLFACFEADVASGHLMRHPIEDAHLDRATHLMAQCPRHPLRALDALHLAVALDLGGHTVVTSDRVMRDACGVLGLSVVDFVPTGRASD